MDSDAYFKAIQFIDALDRRFPENDGVGWLYVVRNNEFKKPLLKIGMTTRPPGDRAAELAGSGVPGHFEIIYFVHVADTRLAEAFAHEALSDYRYQPNKEFFQVSIGKAVSVLDRVAEKLPVLRSQRNRGRRHPRSKPIPQAFPSVVRKCSHCGTKNRVRALAIPAQPRCGSCSREIHPL